MVRRFLMAATVAAGLVAIGSSASAEEPSTRPATKSNFPEGAKMLHLDAGYITERTGEEESVASVVVGQSWYARERVAWGLDAVGYYTSVEEQQAPGIGANIMGRYHFVERGGFSFFGDIGGGLLWTSADFPIDGTQINFTYLAGLGITQKVADNAFFITGARFQHFSNGFYEGRDNNPVMNSYGFYLGLMVRLR